MFLDAIKGYLGGQYWPSKELRLLQIQDVSDESWLMLEKLVQEYLADHVTVPIQQLVNVVERYMPHDSTFARVQTAAEILAVGAEADSWDEENFNFSNNGRKKLVVKDYSKPKPVKKFPVTGRRYEGYLDKSALEILNKSPLYLNREHLKNEEIHPDPELQSEIVKAQEVYESIGNNAFYMDHFMDARGRIYADSYHVNHQSYEYKRASIEFYPVVIPSNARKWIEVDIANQCGLDKYTFEERIKRTGDVEKPWLHANAVRALEACDKGIPTGFVMGLDACASGLQMLAVMSRCEVTAEHTNLKGSQRNDVYGLHHKAMEKRVGHIGLDRKTIKGATMTVFYGSQKTPRETFPDKPVLNAFYESLSEIAPLPTKLIKIIKQCWDNTALYHEWVLPDGHTAHVKVYVPYMKRFEVQELDGKKFTYAYKENEASDYGVSILGNTVHSVDSYVCREMIRRMDKQGIQILTIHDAYYTRPQYMDILCHTYREIMADVMEMDLLEDILFQITKKHIAVPKGSLKIADILNSKHAIC